MKTAHHFLINLTLAIVWVALNKELGIFDFLIGYGIGFAFLWVFKSILHTSSYIQKMKGFVQFIFIFIWLFLKANFNVAKIILFVPKSQINPSFLAYDVSDLSHFEALLMSQFITLTPGTISVSLGKSVLWIHVLDMDNPEETLQEIDEFLKRPILRFTR